MLINEIGKLKGLLGSGGGGTLSAFSTDVQPIASQVILATDSSNYTNGQYYVNSSESYKRMFNHGGGQFSVASRHYRGDNQAAQIYARPFTVNQTTGAITVGTGAASVNTSSNIDTGTFAQAGNYIMTFSTGGGVNNSCHAFTISNNTVTNATYSTNSQYQPVSNNDTAYFRSGNTMYFYPQVYSTNDSRAARLCYSWNGSSFNITEQSNLGSGTTNTSTNYSWPVAPQFGQVSPTTSAGLRIWQNTTSVKRVDILNTTGSYSSTVDIQSSLNITGGMH